MANTNKLKFNENGNLIPKVHEVTLKEIKSNFVNNFPNSKTRQSRWDGFIKFYKDLIENVKSCVYIWINGSFTTKKENPNDIDFTIFLDSTTITNDERLYLLNEISYKEDILVELDKIKYYGDKYSLDIVYGSSFFNYACDFYLCYISNKNSEYYNEYLQEKEYWKILWGKDRNDNLKGFLQLNVNYREDLDAL